MAEASGGELELLVGELIGKPLAAKPSTPRTSSELARELNSAFSVRPPGRSVHEVPAELAQGLDRIVAQGAEEEETVEQAPPTPSRPESLYFSNDERSKSRKRSVAMWL